MRIGIISAVAYIVTVIAANYVTDEFGQIPLGLGLYATAGTLFIGAALLLRNVIQDKFGRRVVLAAIIAGSIVSFLISPQLAVASCAAFLLSELLDMGIYSPLRKHGYIRAVLPASFAGAVTDTVIFLHLAGFPVMANIEGQVVGKYLMTLVAVAAVLAVRIYRQRANVPLET